jgi:hypothetical protein
VPHDLRVITYEAIVAGARVQFLREGTIDMERLANELAVSRASLYRAVDGRDRLLGEAEVRSPPTSCRTTSSLRQLRRSARPALSTRSAAWRPNGCSRSARPNPRAA